MFVLPPVRIQVKRGGIGNVAAGIVRNDRDVITDLILIRPALSGIKRRAHGNICRPGNTAIGAIGVKQLRKKVARIIPGVIPDSIKPPVWRDGKCPEPMPLVGGSIVIDANGGAEA